MSESLERVLLSIQGASPHRPEGVVVDVIGLVLEVQGLRAGVGDLLEVDRTRGAPLLLEIVGFRGGRLVTTPLGPVEGVKAGDRVKLSARGSRVFVGDALLGRILDAFGEPMDAGPRLVTTESYPMRQAPPPAVSRKSIRESFSTGVRAIDGLLTLGRGQRVGIFAGTGVGKTTLLGMLCRTSEADVNVIALVGERGRELNDFIRDGLGPEGLARSVIITATSDMPPLVRARAAETATSIAEYYRDRGKSVLLVMDSVTRYAMAMREAALASGEPPATKGYPPSVFAALPRLLERAGTCGGAGVITAIYTVLVDGDDLQDPVADTVRGILDGHIVLSRSLAERNHYPAIDVLASVSRLAPIVMQPQQVRAAGSVRDLMATYREAQDLIQVGAYVPGSDAKVDASIRAEPLIDMFLRQSVTEPTPFDQTMGAMLQLAAMSGR